MASCAGLPQFVADTSAGRITRSNFKRELPCIETLFAEFKRVLADRDIHNLRRGSRLFAIHFQHSTLCGMKFTVIDTVRGAVVDRATDVGFPDADSVIWNLTICPAPMLVRLM